MKILLAALMCLVLTTAECFALSGGPPYPGAGNFVGQYAGVLTRMGSNSLGVFTLGVPNTGTATGRFIMFTNGVLFRGAIEGVADPNTRRLNALVNASQTRMVQTVTSGGTVVITEVVVSILDGQIIANFTRRGNSSSVSSTLLRGTGEFSQHAPTVDTGLPMPPFMVNGFKQSNAPPTT